VFKCDAGLPAFDPRPTSLRNSDSVCQVLLLYGLMQEAGFLLTEKGSMLFPAIGGLSWQGHDFLDSVRNPDVWAKTKKGAEAAGGFTADLLKDLAKGFVKKQIEEYTGVKL